MDVRRIFDLLTAQQLHCAQKSAISERDNIGWEALSTQDCLDQVKKISVALLKLGVEPGDKILIFSNQGSALWLLLVQAALQTGAIIAPISPEVLDDGMSDFILTSEAKFAFVENREHYEKLVALAKEYKFPKRTLTLYSIADLPNLEDLLVMPLSKQLARIQTLRAAIHEDDIAVIRYGHTQKSYATFSHKEVLDLIKPLMDELYFAKGKAVVSYRKPAAWLEFLLLHAYLGVGAKMVFQKSRLLDILYRVKPVAFGATRHEMETLRKDMISLSEGGSYEKRWITIWAIRTGEQFPGWGNMSLLDWSKHILAEWLRYRHWRRKTGNRVYGVFIEGQLAPATKNLMEAIGIPIYEEDLSSQPTK
jgi:long-chain acyl-CoA synthetase